MDTYFPTFRRIANQFRSLTLWPVREFTAKSLESTAFERWVKCDDETLLRLINVASTHRIPIAPLLRAVAADANTADRMQLLDMSARIEMGVPLVEALEQHPRLASESMILAARTGTTSGTLGPALRSVLDEQRIESDRRNWQELIGNGVYICGVLCVMAGIIAFMAIYVFPTFRQIMDDFGVEPPSAFNDGVRAILALGQWWWVIALLLIGFAVFALTGRMRRSLRQGVLGGLVHPWLGNQTADVLQNLSVVAAAGRPLPSAVSTMARHHCNASIRRRLLYVRNELEHGAELWPTMRRIRLVNETELKLLESASRVGNVPWVLCQLAKRRRSKSRQRRNTLAQLSFPVGIIVLGSIVLWFALAVFMPLTQFIQSAS